MHLMRVNSVFKFRVRSQAERRMFFSRRRSKSSLRADAAEAELAMLREKLQAMQFTNASATQSTETTARPKSESSIRADAAEEELARLRTQMQARHKKRFLKFSCKIGWCTHEGACDSADAGLEYLQRRLTAMEHEMEQLQRFSEIRNEMVLNIAKVEKEIRSKYGSLNALELVIVMDCTDSMGSWISRAKSAVVSIIKNVRRDHPGAKIRIGVVAYRDFCDGDKRLQTQTLTSAATVVQNFISSLRAFGGGDSPEDIPGGLAAALAMPFQAEAKRIVLVADAPCHGSKFNDEYDDEIYRSEINQSPDICAQMREMARRGIDFTIIEVYPPKTAKMVAILREEFNGVKSSDGFKREFQSVSLDNADDAARFESVVSSSASSSISACKQRSSMEVVGRDYGATRRPTARLSQVAEGDEEEESHVAERDEEEEEAPGEEAVVAPPTVKTLDWSDVDHSPDIAAIRHSLHFSPDEHVDWKNLNLKHTQQETTIRLARSCFAKGAMRSAHALYDCNMEKNLVAKLYFGKSAQKVSTSKNSLQTDVEMQIVAKRLAIEFSLCEAVEYGVDFVSTCWYEIKNPATAGLSPSTSMFTAEPYIGGQYKKYNNNNGWRSTTISNAGLNLSETAQAFSHFTWQKTYGELMVVDLQGVGQIFTDPQIHSKHGDKFGCGNLSDAGMTAFFATHECNSVCRALKLTPMKHTESGADADTVLEVADKKSTKRLMTFSCPLCGEITLVLRSEFIKAYRGGRELYCKCCVSKGKTRLRRKCSTCEKKFDYSPYWFSMKGIEIPTSCKNCEAAATKNGAE